MKMKSVSAGEYTAAPAHGPRMALICGMTPEASVLRRKISAQPASENDAFLDARPAGIVQADDRRAVLQRQVEDLADLGGVGLADAAAHDGEILARRRTSAGRPPSPSRTPRRRPGTAGGPGRNRSERCWTNASNSRKEPLSSSSSIRSRADSFPRWCCASIRSWPPPWSDFFPQPDQFLDWLITRHGSSFSPWTNPARLAVGFALWASHRPAPIRTATPITAKISLRTASNPKDCSAIADRLRSRWSAIQAQKQIGMATSVARRLHSFPNRRPIPRASQTPPHTAPLRGKYHAGTESGRLSIVE